MSDWQYRYLTEERELNGWLVNQGKPLTDAIKNGIQSIAERIVNENFLLFYPEEPSTNHYGQETSLSRDYRVPHYVLQPLSPELGPSCPWCSKSPAGYTFVKVDSVTPMFKWEQFPRDFDYVAADGNGHHFEQIVYDLRILNTDQKYRQPGLPAYKRNNISEPFHKIGEELLPCTRYYWAVRARFKLDGRPRALEWAEFPFMTPCS